MCLVALQYPGSPPLKKQAELFFPPDFADDFPVSMQVRLSKFRGRDIFFAIHLYPFLMCMT
jgi:hypothetical protein